MVQHHADSARWCEVVQNGARWCCMVQDDATYCRCNRKVPDGAGWCRMINGGEGYVGEGRGVEGRTEESGQERGDGREGRGMGEAEERERKGDIVMIPFVDDIMLEIL